MRLLQELQKDEDEYGDGESAGWGIILRKTKLIFSESHLDFHSTNFGKLFEEEIFINVVFFPTGIKRPS